MNDELEAWLGPVMDEASEEQLERIVEASKAIDRRYPIPDGGCLADVVTERNDALSAAVQVILGDSTLEEKAAEYSRAQLAAFAAHAQQTGALIAEGQVATKVELARRSGLSRVSVDKAFA